MFSDHIFLVYLDIHLYPNKSLIGMGRIKENTPNKLAIKSQHGHSCNNISTLISGQRSDEGLRQIKKICIGWKTTYCKMTSENGINVLSSLEGEKPLASRISSSLSRKLCINHRQRL